MFIQFLCVCLELAINTLLADSSVPSSTGADDSGSSSSSFVLALKDKLKGSSSSSFVFALRDKLKGANWSALAGIIRVLRYILKSLTPDNHYELISVYFDSVNSCLSNVPWDSFTGIFVALDGDDKKSSMREVSFQSFIFLGNFVQLLSSLVEQSGAVEAAVGSMNKHPVVSLIIVLVPKLLSWCPGKQGDCVNKSIFQYFRHKLLVWSTWLFRLMSLNLDHKV